MSEMVERVRQAIMEARCLGGCENMDECWCNQDAIAAIKGMREPTEAMLEAGQLGGEISRQQAREAWQAMIDETLK